MPSERSDPLVFSHALNVKLALVSSGQFWDVTTVELLRAFIDDCMRAQMADPPPTDDLISELTQEFHQGQLIRHELLRTLWLDRRKVQDRGLRHIMIGHLGDGDADGVDLARLRTAISGSGDSHLHAGGISSPGELLAPIVESVVSSPRLLAEPIRGLDSVGRPFDVRGLIFYAALLSLRYLDDRLVNDHQLSRIVEDRFPRGLMRAAWAPEADTAAWRSLVGHASEVTGMYPDFEWLARTVIRDLEAGVVNDDVSAGFNVVAALNRVASVPKGIGLDGFVARFRKASALRKLGSDGETARIERSLMRLWCGGFSSRMELRKNIDVPGDAPATMSGIGAELLHDVALYIGSALEIRHKTKADLVVSLPISFQKASFHGSLGWNLGGYLAAAEALSQLVLREPDVASALGGVDVVGLEAQTPNWVLSLAYQWLERRIDQSDSFIFSAHAGEQYPNIWTGLRRIGEWLVHFPAVSRIGHCLALGDSDVNGGPPSAVEALMDAVWALEFTRSGELAAFACDLADFLAPVCRVRSIDDVVNSVRTVYSLDAMTELGFVPRARRHTVFDVVDFYPPIPRCTFTAEQNWLALRIIGVGRDGKVLPDQAMPFALRQRYMSMMPLVLEELREGVINRIGDRVVECCPTSNVAIGHVKDYEDHPLWRFVEWGLHVTVSTDDPGLFGVTLLSEYLRLWSSSELGNQRNDAVFGEIARRGMERTAKSISVSDMERAFRVASR